MKRAILDTIMCILTGVSVLLIGSMQYEYISGEYTVGAFVKLHWQAYVVLAACGIPAAWLWLRRFD